ncbi:SHOCT domain-containing protein [Streptomyces sp. NPDC003863]
MGLVRHVGGDGAVLGPPHHRRRVDLPHPRPCRGTAPRQGPAAAEQILGERLARGEIDEEEYRRRLSALRRGDS